MMRCLYLVKAYYNGRGTIVDRIIDHTRLFMIDVSRPKQ